MKTMTTTPITPNNEERNNTLVTFLRPLHATLTGMGGALTLFHNMRGPAVTPGIEAAAKVISEDPILTGFILNIPDISEDIVTSLYPNIVEQLTICVDPDEDIAPPDTDTARGYARMLWYFRRSQYFINLINNMLEDPTIPITEALPLCNHPVIEMEKRAGYINMKMAMAFTEYVSHETPLKLTNVLTEEGE